MAQEDRLRPREGSRGVKRAASFDIRFLADGIQFVNPADRQRIKECSAYWQGKEGYLEIAIGNRTRSYKQNRFFHGPLINAFVRWTGTSNPDYWKSYLKGLFLKRFTDDGKEYVAETSSLSVHEFSAFIDQCVQHLIDEGGHLEEREGEEWKSLKGEEVAS